MENDIYKVNDTDFLVWEKIITKNRQININIYSKYIFKNKTNCIFQIKLLNQNLEYLFILLKPNSYSGIPLSYCNEQTSFNFKFSKDIDSQVISENLPIIDKNQNYQSIRDCFNLFFDEEDLEDPLFCHNCNGPENFSKKYSINMEFYNLP